MNWSLTRLLLRGQTIKNTEGVRRNKNQKSFERHTQKAFLRKNTEGYPFDSKNSNLLEKSKT
jgi:hypothetical protein